MPIPKVKAVSEAEVFRVVQSGKRKSKGEEEDELYSFTFD